MSGLVLRHDATQLVSYNQAMTNPRWLGRIGHVNSLVYDFNLPGGCDTLSANLEVEATRRTDGMEPGRILQGVRGADVCWEGIMQEPVPSPTGWAISAIGAGNYGNYHQAVFSSTWPTNQPDQPINNAISRGMRWTNPTIGQPSGIYLGSPLDSAASTITDLLNQMTSLGGLTWYVNTSVLGNIISVFPLPNTPNRLLISNTPVARTLGGDINAVYVRYLVSDDGTNPAVYATTTVTNAASIAKYGRTETYLDLSSDGVLTAGQAQAVASAVLQKYVRASFTAPFVVSPGQLLTMGGQPVDLGFEQAGSVYQLLLTDYAYGGELSLAAPLSFLGGRYAYDDDTQTATITPFQSINTSFSGLLEAAASVIVPKPAIVPGEHEPLGCRVET